MEKNLMINRCRLVIIGGSAGSLEVLMQIIPRLQNIESFAMVIVLHRMISEDTVLEELFAAKTAIPVKFVEDKTPVEPGNIYIAPSDYHLLFEKEEVLSLDISPKVNYSRPSIDVSFESAAEVYGSALVGILLSGANSDGTIGLKVIQKMHGHAVVQDPESADMPYMPRNAIENLTPDYILNPEEILEFIVGLNR